MRRAGNLLRGAVVGFIILGAAMPHIVMAREEGPEIVVPSNLALLRRAGVDAARAATEELPLDRGQTVAIQAWKEDKTQTFWEDILLTELDAMGYKLVRLAPRTGTGGVAAGGTRRGRRGAQGSAGAPEEVGTGTETPDSASVDSTLSAAEDETENEIQGEGETAEAETPVEADGFEGPRLVYESLELSIDYPRGRRGILPGQGCEVERMARAGLLLTFEAGPDGGSEWTGRGEGVAHDSLPQELLPYAESGDLPVDAPQWSDRGFWGRLLEPALVVGIVSGLVFLFYANRAEQ